MPRCSCGYYAPHTPCAVCASGVPVQRIVHVQTLAGAEAMGLVRRKDVPPPARVRPRKPRKVA